MSVSINPVVTDSVVDVHMDVYESGSDKEPGGIENLTDVECPTEEYYTALAADMRARHPDAGVHVLEHLDALEAFLDVAILAGFSFGAGDKAQVIVETGKLLDTSWDAQEPKQMASGQPP